MASSRDYNAFMSTFIDWEWKSEDKSIKKNVLNPGVFGKKPTEFSTCTIIVDKIDVFYRSILDKCRSLDGFSDEYQLSIKKFEMALEDHSTILYGKPEKTVIIGEASSELDEKIERAICTMNINERSYVNIDMSLEQMNLPSSLLEQMNPPSRLSDRSMVECIIIEFVITLTHCYNIYNKPVFEWSAEEKYEVALRYKGRGAELFKDSRIVDAFRKFSSACKLLITLEPSADLELDKQLELNINDLRLALYNNMAICQLKRKNYQDVVTLCNQVLDKDGNNVKALYRRGVAYGNMGDNEKAVTDLKAVLTLEPSNHSAKEQFDIYNTRLQESIQKNKDMVKRMFKRLTNK